jgi:hypothetical protein
VGVAAVHTAVGSPLGPTFAAEVWSLAKTFVAVSLTYSGFGGFVVANNRRAWAALDEHGVDAENGDACGDARGRQAQGELDFEVTLPPPRPITSRTNPARVATGRHAVVTTDALRRRRTGRLTPVAPPPPPEAQPAPPEAPTVNEHGQADGRKDGPTAGADPAGPGDRKPRQAGGGGNPR